MENENLTRCFIAIDIPREIIEEIERIQKELKNKNIFHGKLTEPENLHLTLKFLSEIPENKIIQVKEKLKQIKFPNFNAFLGELGVFSKNYIKICWIHILGKQILELQKEIDKSLNPLFQPEERFMSHLTIARIKNTKDKKLFLQELRKISTQNLEFNVNQFILFKSDLKETGPEYTILEEFPLI